MGSRRFCEAEGLHVEIYDARLLVDLPGSPVDGDVDFYLSLAAQTGGPVLELGAGTGRVAWALADAGHTVVGLDLSAAMLRRAEAKRAERSAERNARIRFVEGTMAEFALRERFALVLVPFRAFQSLLEVEEQRRCLACIRSHLEPGGRVVLDLFDPRLDLCHGGAGRLVQPRPDTVTNPATGHAVNVTAVSRTNDCVRQVLHEVWRLTERDADGRVLREEDEWLELRWTYRYEMRHLLELCGFEVVAEQSDFRGSPPAYGREQVWIARLRP